MVKYAVEALQRSAQQPQYIDNNAALAQCCQHWQTLPVIALDTEFLRVNTFYPIAGLIQVADDRACYLLDPLAISDFSPLIALFEQPDVIKILHAGSEDLELFNRFLGVLPAPVFDTQLAAAFVGWGYSMGLQRLVQQTLGINLAKGETTSDWLGRPLSARQCVYAAQDVAYLPAIYQTLHTLLEQQGRLSWFEQESQDWLAAARIDSDDSEYYRRFSQMWGLAPDRLAGLRDLAQWREQQSRLRDVPRNRILRNQALLSVIQRWPQDLEGLGRIRELSPRTLAKDGPAILAILAQAPASARQQPPLPINRPLHVRWNQPLKAMKALARQQAEQLTIAPELLLRKKDLEGLIRSGLDNSHYRLPAGLQGWREPVIGQRLLDYLNQYTAS